MHCLSCQKEILENSKFCLHCGAPVAPPPNNAALAAERLAAAKAAVRANPNQAQGWFELGDLLQAVGQTDRAEECFQRARALAPPSMPQVPQAPPVAQIVAPPPQSALVVPSPPQVPAQTRPAIPQQVPAPRTAVQPPALTDSPSAPSKRFTSIWWKIGMGIVGVGLLLMFANAGNQLAQGVLAMVFYGGVVLALVMPYVMIKRRYNKALEAKTGLKNRPPITISSTAYNEANSYFPKVTRSAPQPNLPPEKLSRRQRYLSEAEMLARQLGLLEYDGSSLRIVEMIARMILAYDLQAETYNYPDVLQRDNIEIGVLDTSNAKERRMRILKRSDLLNNQLAPGDTVITTMLYGTNAETVMKRTLEGIINDMKIGPFSSDLHNLLRSLHYNDVAKEIIINLHQYIKGLELATVRIFKEEF